ncbi:hypothetical protein N7456_005248 [Penicillium angulare]|uniref:SPX, N-terminal n=1 Tax=Penicillium angulare TaxID=116970 RepID=A0A9W9FY76_9EURO|nr:hypothetical protein N7456_005248 [Penicillium angulare]
MPSANDAHRDLEKELFPEWRAKYIDYKTGKKKIRAIARAIQKGNRSGRTPSFRSPILRTPSFQSPTKLRQRSNTHNNSDGAAPEDASDAHAVSTATPTRQAPRTPGSRFSDNAGNYGSIVASPPMSLSHRERGSDMDSLRLPKAAMDVEEEHVPPEQDLTERGASSPVGHFEDEHTEEDISEDGYSEEEEEVQERPGPKRSPTFLRRVFSQTNGTAEFEKREAEYFVFLDGELDKIDSFYRERQMEAQRKLDVLSRQLDIMRRARAREYNAQYGDDQQQGQGPGKFFGSRIRDTFTGRTRFGKNTRALVAMETPRIPEQENDDAAHRRDYTRRPDSDSAKPAVPYREAKHQLKRALQEYYRGLEVLKDYALLNIEGFRKINKKYNKTIKGYPGKAQGLKVEPSMGSMTDIVNKASFADTKTVELLMREAEELYARFFAGRDRKIAVSKLRHNVNKSTDYSFTVLISGMLLGIGIICSIWGLVLGLSSPVPPLVQRSVADLRQIYGGYFLIVFHFLLFWADCIIWTRSKVNYGFVFEYDSMHMLDWRQFLGIPAFFMLILGICMLVNFQWFNAMYIYWPVLLIGATVIIVFLPAPILYHRSRKWWAATNWRLLLPCFYRVEFRDLFLGDMYCSQSYAMGNIELFFCLYANGWNSPAQCNSSHSRLLGFFTCLPSTMRAFQCIRRYWDSKKPYPHLLNMVKYICGILYYATLSMYRIDRQTSYKASFIFFAAMNACFTSFWDVVFDWSLGNFYNKENWLLRDTLTFRRKWVYYVAALLNIIIRFNWIFYAIYANDIQHSAILSFMISLSEVLRRGIWVIFRVENEHCENVRLVRAFREPPLPYPVSPPLDGAVSQEVTPTDVERVSGPRRASTIVRIGNRIAGAHVEDFERRRPPAHFVDNFLDNAMAHNFAHAGEDWSDDESGPG